MVNLKNLVRASLMAAVATAAAAVSRSSAIAVNAVGGGGARSRQAASGPGSSPPPGLGRRHAAARQGSRARNTGASTRRRGPRALAAVQHVLEDLGLAGHARGAPAARVFTMQHARARGPAAPRARRLHPPTAAVCQHHTRRRLSPRWQSGYLLGATVDARLVELWQWTREWAKTDAQAGGPKARLAPAHATAQKPAIPAV